MRPDPHVAITIKINRKFSYCEGKPNIHFFYRIIRCIYAIMLISAVEYMLAAQNQNLEGEKT